MLCRRRGDAGATVAGAGRRATPRSAVAHRDVGRRRRQRTRGGVQLETTCRGKVRRCGGGGGREEEGRHHGSGAASDPTLGTAPARGEEGLLSGRTTTSFSGMEVGGGRGGAVEAGAEAGGGVGEAADRHDIAPQPGAAHRHAFHPSLETRAGREGTSGSHLNMTHRETKRGARTREPLRSQVNHFILLLLLLIIIIIIYFKCSDFIFANLCLDLWRVLV